MFPLKADISDILKRVGDTVFLLEKRYLPFVEYNSEKNHTLKELWVIPKTPMTVTGVVTSENMTQKYVFYNVTICHREKVYKTQVPIWWVFDIKNYKPKEKDTKHFTG